MDLSEEIVRRLRSQDPWEVVRRPCMEEKMWAMRQKSST